MLVSSINTKFLSPLNVRITLSPLSVLTNSLFFKYVLAGTKAMYKNDGSKTNEEVFWNYFKEVYGEKVISKKEESNK